MSAGIAVPLNDTSARPLGPLDALQNRVDLARGPLARWLMLAIAIAISLIAMAEIDRLIASVVDAKGGSYSLSSVIGPLSIIGQDAWASWATNGTGAIAIGWWIVCSVTLDVAFYVLYVIAAYAFIGKFANDRGVKQSTMELVVRWLLGVEIIESVILLIGAWSINGGPVVIMPIAEGSISIAKWVLTVALIVVLLRNEGTRRTFAKAIKRSWQAVWIHRLSAVPVVLLAALSCVPGEGILDQLPDVQRQWLGDPSGLWPLSAAALAIVLAVLAAFALGRARTRRGVFRWVVPTSRPTLPIRRVIGWWLMPVAGWLLVFVVALAAGARSQNFGAGAFLFVGVPIAVLLASAWVDACARRKNPKPQDPTDEMRRDRVRARYTWLVGDVLAMAVLTVGGLGLVRSMVLPVFLQIYESVPDPIGDSGAVQTNESIPDLSWTFMALGLGIGVAMLSPLLLIWWRKQKARKLRIIRGLVASNDPTERRAPTVDATALVEVSATETSGQSSWDQSSSDQSSSDQSLEEREAAVVKAEEAAKAEAATARRHWKWHQRWQIIIMIVATVLLTLLALFPDFSDSIGPVATTVLAITCWTAVLGSFAVALQEYQPLSLFRAMRLQATPVLTLGLVIPLVYGAVLSTTPFDGSPHEIRTLETPTAASEESTIADRLDNNDCTITVGGKQIKPVLLVAAEGGGIRAAYWTGQAMELLHSEMCFETTVLASSGISGGSVGLALAGISSATPMKDRLTSLASSDTLANAASGLLVSDVLASAMGIKVPSYIEIPDKFKMPPAATDAFGWRWRDRAALIETGWITDVPQLGRPYTSTPNDRTGFMLLNSTDVDSGCRVVVGSADVIGGEPTPRPAATDAPESTDSRCSTATFQPAVSWWLGDDCQRHIDRATAAMLSARFPIVTPAGRPPKEQGCDANGQLVDGGYAEATGLGTLADIAPDLAAAIRAHNATADVPYVPIVVYLRNSSGFDIVESVSDVTAEPLVPLVGFAAKAKQLTDAAWLQRLSGAVDDVCGDGSALRNADCRAAVEATRSVLSGQVVVVAPESRPTVVPPLGWALSTFSIDSMDEALESEAVCEDKEAVADHFARLCALFNQEQGTPGYAAGSVS